MRKLNITLVVCMLLAMIAMSVIYPVPLVRAPVSNAGSGMLMNVETANQAN